MRRVNRRGGAILAPVLVVAAALLPQFVADAAIPQPEEPPPTFVVQVTTPPSENPGTPGSGTSGEIECVWINFDATPDHADTLNTVTEIIVSVINSVLWYEMQIVLTYFSENGDLHAWDAVDGRFEVYQRADCSRATVANGVTTGDGRWVATTPPSPAILVPGAVASATGAIEPPTPAISPPDEAAMNLGLWLAVETEPPIRARARLGPLWADATARLASTSFDLGNGDRPVVCSGNGSLIPNSKRGSVEAGPCGYTFTDYDDIGPTTITMTSTWEITWVRSDGVSGSQPAIVVGTALPYEVYEIQTVGVGD